MIFYQIFDTVIETTKKEDNLQQRLQTLLREITLAIYTNVSRGLFEKHKLVFSVMLNIAIHIHGDIVSQAQWNFMLRGPTQIVVVGHVFLELITTDTFQLILRISHIGRYTELSNSDA